MEVKIKRIFFILLFFYCAFFVFGSLFSPIMATIGQYDISAKLTSLYMFSCHQQPDRSFWIFGYPVALCSRCLGVYISVLFSSLLVVCNKFRLNKRLLTGFIVLSFVDIFVNCGIGIRAYNTGNITRFVIGMLMGVIIVFFINKIFSLLERN